MIDRRRMRAPWILAIVLAACGSPVAQPPPARRPQPQPEPARPKDCTTAANDAGKFLTTMDHDEQLLSLEDISPALRADLKARGDTLRQAPVVEIRTGGLFYQGQLATPADLAERLDAAHQMIVDDIHAGRVPRSEAPDPAELIVVPDRGARWNAVVDALATAHHAGFDHVTIVFAAPNATPPPPHTRVDDEIQQLMKQTDPGHRATALAGYIRPHVQPCPALLDVFGEVGASEMDDRAGYMLSHVAPALIACHCAVDPAEMTSLFWEFLANPHPLALLAITLDPKQKPITAAADARWDTVNGLLSATSSDLWLAVAR